MSTQVYLLLVKDADEGGTHTTSGLTTFTIASSFSKAHDALALDTLVNELLELIYNGLADPGMRLWGDLTVLPTGSVAQVVVNDEVELEKFLYQAFAPACCVGWI